MARFIIENRISTIEELKSFTVDGYYFVDAESSGNELVFKKRRAEEITLSRTVNVYFM